MLQKIMEVVMPIFNEAIPHIFPSAPTAFITARVREVLFDGVLVNCSHPFTDYPAGPVCQGMRSRAPVTFRRDGKNYYFSLFNHVSDSAWRLTRTSGRQTTRGRWPGLTRRLLHSAAQRHGQEAPGARQPRPARPHVAGEHQELRQRLAAHSVEAQHALQHDQRHRHHHLPPFRQAARPHARVRVRLLQVGVVPSDCEWARGKGRR